MALTLDATTIEALLLGGAVLGGGGGGSIDVGHRWAMVALERGRPRLVRIDELAADAPIATVSLIGAPASHDRFVTPEDLVRAVQLLQDHLDAPIAGLITSENGGAASANGLVQSAVLGLPVVDAPCNGRAHPTGVMGSMGLGRVPGFLSRQAAVGGDPACGRHVELFVAAPLVHADTVVRAAAVEAGGLVAVARNPVPLEYVRQHGAPGALGVALRLGERMIAARPRGGAAAARAIVDHLGGSVLDAAEVSDLQIETRGGYDVGRCRIGSLDLTFWNEFMTADRDGARLVTFPDLIVTLDAQCGTPIPTAELVTGQRVIAVAVPRAHLLLGAGVRDPDNLRVIEATIGVSILEFAC